MENKQLVVYKQVLNVGRKVCMNLENIASSNTTPGSFMILIIMTEVICNNLNMLVINLFRHI